jgi:hypothetical protein
MRKLEWKNPFFSDADPDPVGSDCKTTKIDRLLTFSAKKYYDTYVW